jgi:hypothetical protein
MLAFTPITVNATGSPSLTGACRLALETLTRNEDTSGTGEHSDGIIKVTELEVQDPKAAAVLAEYPELRWAEITRRALKIGLGYLKGGAKD